MNHFTFVLYTLGIVLLTLFLSGNLKTSGSNQINDNNYAVLTDSLVAETIKNRYGQQIIKKSMSVFRAKLSKKELDLRQADSTIQQLQKLITKNTQSATVVETTSQIKITEHIKRDTINNVDTVYINTGWTTGIGLITTDSLFLQLDSKDELHLTHEYVKKSLFAPKKLKVTASLQNPASDVTRLQSYTILSPKREIFLTGNAGLQYTSDVSLRPFVGLGLVFSTKRVLAEATFNRTPNHNIYRMSLGYKFLTL